MLLRCCAELPTPAPVDLKPHPRVFRKVLMAGCVQQIDLNARVLKRQRRRRNRNTCNNNCQTLSAHVRLHAGNPSRLLPAALAHLSASPAPSLHKQHGNRQASLDCTTSIRCCLLKQLTVRCCMLGCPPGLDFSSFMNLWHKKMR